ncbi:MAG: DUF2235 domain-containing protein [Verrucomicrobiota bacterium]
MINSTKRLVVAAWLMLAAWQGTSFGAECKCKTVSINKLSLMAWQYVFDDSGCQDPNLWPDYYPPLEDRTFNFGGQCFNFTTLVNRFVRLPADEYSWYVYWYTYVAYDSPADLSLEVDDQSWLQISLPAVRSDKVCTVTFGCGVEKIDVVWGNITGTLVIEEGTSKSNDDRNEHIWVDKQGCLATLHVSSYSVGMWGDYMSDPHYTGIETPQHPHLSIRIHKKPDRPATCRAEGGLDLTSPQPSASFSSGTTAAGGSNGSIVWSAAGAEEAVSLNSIHLPGVGGGATNDFLQDETDYHQTATRWQYKTATQLFDAEKTGDDLVLKFYDTQNLGPLTGGFYNPSAGLRKTITYAKSGDAVSVSTTEGGTTETSHVLEWNPQANTTSWTDLTQSKKWITIRGMNRSNELVTSEEWCADNTATYVLVSRTSREYEQPASGAQRLIQTTHDPVWPGRANPANLVESLHYGADGTLDRQIMPDGSWSIETHDGDDLHPLPPDGWNQVVTYTPWLNATCPESGLPQPGNCVARVVWDDGYEITTTETYTAGILSGREESYTLTDSGCITEITKTYTDCTTNNFLVSKRLTYPPNQTPAINSGRLFRTIDAAGRTRTYSYANMSLDAGGLFRLDPAGTFVATYATDGTIGHEDGLLDADGHALTTRTLTIADADGNTVRSEIQAYLGAPGYETMSVTRYLRTFNLDGSVHMTSTYQDDRLIAEEEIISRNETRITDEEGIVDIQTTDSQGRSSTVVCQGITTTYNYAGLTTTVTQAAAGMTPRTTTTIRNLVGDVICETDEAGTTTTYSNDPTHRTATTTRNGVTTTTSRYLDGQFLSTAGNGVIPSRATYQVESNGFITTTASTGAENTHGARWTETTADWAGRTCATKCPAPLAPDGTRYPDIITTYGYDGSTGAPCKTTATAGPSPMLYLSDASGTTTSSGLDVNADGNLNPADGDRVSISRSFYQKIGGEWWQVNLESTAISATTSRNTSSRRGMNVGAGEVRVTTSATGATTTTSRTFDRPHQTATTTVASADGTQTSIEIGGLLMRQTLPGSSNPATYNYDSFGREKSRSDPRGAFTWTFYYNGSSQLDHVTDHLGHTTSYLYYPANHINAGQLWKVTDPGDGCTEYVYNSRGQTTEVRGNATYHQVFGYDAQGDQATLDTYGSVAATTTWHRDPATGLLTFKEYADGKGTRYGYTPDGKVATRTWQRGVTTRYSYDPVTRDHTRIDYSDATPAVVFSNHDLLGRPALVAEARASGDDLTTLSYDPVTGSQSTGYAATHSVLPHLAVIANPADTRGRATGHSVSQGDTPIHGWTYGFDNLGRIGGVTSGTLNVEFGYQPGTRMVNEQTTRSGTETLHQSKRAIDLLGRTVGMASRAPDPATGGAMRIVASVGHEYDRRHRRQNARREDGTRWNYGYNDRSEVTSAVKSLPDSQLVPGQSLSYDFDGMGNRKTSSAGTAPDVARTTYAPDALNHYASIATPGIVDILVRAPNPVTVTAAGTNAPVTRQGNLFNAHATVANAPDGRYYGVTVTDGTTTLSGNRWLAPASVSPLHDDDGNLTRDGRWTYTWDAENRLIQLSTLPAAIAAGAPALTLTHTYDFLSRRIRTTATTAGTPATTTEESTLYEDWNPVATFSNGTLTQTLLWGLDLSATPQGAGGIGGLLAVTDHRPASAGCYIPSYDANGNIIAWTDRTGLLIRRLDYDPFGNTLLKETLVTRPGLDSSLTRGFSTKPTDPASGLLYFGYRFYDPACGRWLGRDPIGEEGGVNLYGFVGNDGVNQIDVMGLALYSFDGTWNDKNQMNNPTNVWKLHDVYQQKHNKFYFKGVGTNTATKLVGGVTGAGGQNRIGDAYKALVKQVTHGDCEIDIIGFSRGAAEAREFSNKIARDAVVVNGVKNKLRVRFLGLFDTVASEGIPGNGFNFGYDLKIRDHVDYVAHATANDESRYFFPLHSIKSRAGEPNTPRRQERGFPGSHSDVGGGYDDSDLSDGSLLWMWQRGVAAGAPFGPLPPASRKITNPKAHAEGGPQDPQRRIFYP